MAAPIKTPELEKLRARQTDLQKQLQDLRRANPEYQLKSKLDAAKNRLSKQIDDLEKQISANAKTIKIKPNQPLNMENSLLTERRNELKKQFDTVFGKEGISDTKRLELWKKNATKRITELQAKIAAGDFSSVPRRAEQSLDAEGQKLKARHQRLKEQFRLGAG